MFKFCPICCQNSFGDNYPKEKEECFQYCDDNPLDIKSLPSSMANDPFKHDMPDLKSPWTFVPHGNNLNGQSRNDFGSEDDKKKADAIAALGKSRRRRRRR